GQHRPTADGSLPVEFHWLARDLLDCGWEVLDGYQRERNVTRHEPIPEKPDPRPGRQPNPARSGHAPGRLGSGASGPRRWDRRRPGRHRPWDLADSSRPPPKPLRDAARPRPRRPRVVPRPLGLDFVAISSLLRISPRIW